MSELPFTIATKRIKYLEIQLKKKVSGPGTVAHACNPRTLGGWGGWITRSGDRDHLGKYGETPSLLKIQKISWAWWCVPVIPATQEAEAEELPGPRRRRLWWAEIAPLHSSLGNKSETPSQKKTEKKNYSENFQIIDNTYGMWLQSRAKMSTYCLYHLEICIHPLGPEHINSTCNQCLPWFILIKMFLI